MPITIDATVGGGSSNSYVTAAEADIILAGFPYTHGWDSASEAERDEALAYAVLVIERTYTFKGTRTYADQALAWPRDGLYNKDGIGLAEDAYPLDIQRGQCQLADLILAGDRESEGDSMAGIRRVKVGPLELELQPWFSGVIGQGGIIPSYIRALFEYYVKYSPSEWTIPILRA